MKKLCCLTLLVIFALRSICVGSKEKPEDGVWFCAQLSLAIDFSEYSEERDTDIATYYGKDGTSVEIDCYFDNGEGNIAFCNPVNDECYMEGDYEYEDGVFYVTSDESDKLYTFQCIQA